ncbi:MAG: 3,4-dihydroxy-2-butanone-4-phosphate synthase [Pseudomonadota bacterium]
MPDGHKLPKERRELIERAIAEYREGKFLLVSDDEDRENEGDLVIAAEHTTPDAVNFMITYGKGLVCVAITEEIARQKNLKPMVEKNEDSLGTAFTVSVDASAEHGITTGISAAERAKTVQVLIDDQYGSEHIQVPGHMFPLVAKPGGLKVRRGHTEAGVELSRLAGCKFLGSVIVEVIKDDGKMARRDDLIEMSEKFGITYITIEELARYVEEVESEEAAA